MRLRIETQNVGRRTRVAIAGTIDEQADLGSLTPLRGDVEIDLRDVGRINSYGARVWINCIRELAEHASLTFVAISPTVVMQLNMIEGFLAHGRVRSFCGPMVCDACGEHHTVVFAARDCLDVDVRLPPTQCPSCAGDMTLDDLEDQYLLFLREPTHVA